MSVSHKLLLQLFLLIYFCNNFFSISINAQHGLITLTEKWKKSVDNGEAFGALFTDLSKAFDCLSLELLIAKLDAYGFDKNALKSINSYLTYRKQSVKINDKYSSWSEMLFEVSQGSILGPALFNVFICDMIYFLEDFDIANYADNSTPYNAGENIEFVVNNLEQSSLILFKRFNNNYMKVNADKSHLLVSGNVIAVTRIDNNHIESKKEQM